MATVILYLMAVWDMDTVMEATVTSPNTGTTITGIHTGDTDIHMTILTVMVRPQATLLIWVQFLLWLSTIIMHQLCYLVLMLCENCRSCFDRNGVWYSVINF